MVICDYCSTQFNGIGRFCCNSCEILYAWLKEGKSPIKNILSVSKDLEKFNFSEIDLKYNLNQSVDTNRDFAYKRYRFYIEGLQCSSCVHLLEDLPQFEKKVISSRLNFGKCLLELETNQDILLGELCQMITDLGYRPTPLLKESDYDLAKKIENRKDLIKIAVAGAVAGNEMLFSIPLYAGLQGDLATVFKWISFFIFLPLLFYSAQEFYKKSWIGLLIHRLSVDMMIVVALWSGFLFSTYSLLSGGDEIYFDSTASFIFLILITRFFLKKYQDKFIHKDLFTELFVNEIYEVSKGDLNVFRTSFDQIKESQLIKMQQNQLLPCDAVLLTDECEFDVSFLTGEAYPQKKHKNEAVYAGSRLLSSQALILCKSQSHQSALAKSLKSLEVVNESKNKFKYLADVVSHRLTLVVFSLAGLYYLFTFDELGVEAFKRSLALITIACPCAVAFGAPLAQSIGLKKAFKEGFYIRSESVFEKLHQIKKIIFDKTGTLTSTHLELIKTFPHDLSEENKEIILGLEKKSMHPVAISLKKTWAGTATKNIKQIKEVIGQGVEGQYNDHQYRLGKPLVQPADGSLQVDLSIDEKKTAYLFFQEKLKPESAKLVDKLYDREFTVMLLSGDIRSRALDVGKQLLIRPANIFSEQSEESKKHIIEKENPCLYIGDGLNDLKALQAAAVSFAVRGPFEATFQICDIYAPRKNLMSILEIFDLSKKVYSVIQSNLMFAIFYNSIGGILALGGFINPLMAAVLMPISSILIIGHTVWRLR